MTESPLTGTEVQGAREPGSVGQGSGGPGDIPSKDTAPNDTAPKDAAPQDGSGPVVHPRVWQRRVAVLREHAHRRLRWIVGGVAVLVVLCVALLVLHTPLLALRHATVRGAPHTGSEAVLQAAGLLDDPPLIDVDPKTVAAHVEALPWVAHAVVVRHWPDSVTIIVTERVPLGSVARPGGGVALVDASPAVPAPSWPGPLVPPWRWRPRSPPCWSDGWCRCAPTPGGW
jgi:hypothetical protein